MLVPPLSFRSALLHLLYVVQSHTAPVLPAEERFANVFVIEIIDRYPILSIVSEATILARRCGILRRTPSFCLHGRSLNTTPDSPIRP